MLIFGWKNIAAACGKPIGTIRNYHNTIKKIPIKKVRQTLGGEVAVDDDDLKKWFESLYQPYSKHD